MYCEIYLHFHVLHLFAFAYNCIGIYLILLKLVE